jgi:EAL domain-containing protein (putative c-di-GMP-specific phosphodiesterase class I)/PAS domain-containing protein
MATKSLNRAVRTYISAFLVIGLAGVLVFAIYFTQADLPWVTFLTGIFVASILALTARASRSEWALTRRSAKLSSVQDKLAQEMAQRRKAEAALAAVQPRLYLIDEALEVMVVYADAAGNCLYHNRPFRDWLNLGPHQIDGRPLRNVLGPQVYGEMAADIRQVMEGRPVEAHWVQKTPKGAAYRLSARYLPHLGGKNVLGFHALITDFPEQEVRAAAAAQPAAPKVEAAAESGEQIDMASRIVAALQKDEFSLFRQKIVSLQPGQPEHYEVLIRLMEEEDNMMPPGAFFPVAEKYGLMPHLDRWVVGHVIERASYQKRSDGSMFFINVSGATITDKGFAKFLAEQLARHGVQGGVLCFEVAKADFRIAHADAVEFARQVRAHGCRVALSGFGRDQVSMDVLRDFQLDFLKIDGRVILGVLRDPAFLARVVAIQRIAKAIGVKTVAELVEDDATIAKLRALGVDLAQGFGIDRPQVFTR